MELGGYGDGRTQGQRDRDYNRAVLAAAERGSVSTFELLQTDRQARASESFTHGMWRQKVVAS